jgi:5,10-methylenetetrahydrofolate reductase
MSFADTIEKENFTLLAEVDPPKGAGLDEFLDTVLSIKGRVDAVAVTDSPHAIMGMTPLAPCRMLIEKNIEPVMIFNGRDRNRIGFQGDLLGAWALGVKNVLLTEGQDPAVGDQPMAKACGDLNLEVMHQSVQGLNRGKDLGGESLNQKTGFSIGTILEVSDDVNVNRPRAQSIPRLAELGASFVVLAPTYDVNIIDMYARAAEDAGVKLLASVMLLKSVAMIRYLNNLPGVPNIPHEFLKQMTSSPVKQQAGMEIAKSLVKDIEQRCQGAVLIALGWGNRLPEFLDLVGR